LALEQWADGKLLLLAMFAHEVATSAEACFRVCQLARDDEFVGPAKSLPPLEEWCRLYRQGVRIGKTVIGGVDRHGAIKNLNGVPDEGVKGVRISKTRLRKELLKVKDWPRLVRQSHRRLREDYTAHLEALRREASGETKAQDFRAMVKVPEVLFFFRVWLPCLLEYGKTAEELFASAQAGKMDAIEKLLRLDKKILEEPKIREHYYKAREQKNEARFRRFEKALAGGVTTPLNMVHIKIILGALIHKWCSQMDERYRKIEAFVRKKQPGFRLVKARLTAPQVRGLFDAVAKDFKGLERDENLEAAPHGNYLSLTRNWKVWPNLP